MIVDHVNVDDAAIAALEAECLGTIELKGEVLRLPAVFLGDTSRVYIPDMPQQDVQQFFTQLAQAYATSRDCAAAQAIARQFFAERCFDATPPAAVAEEFDGYCGECHAPCYGISADFGIGSYEFWGERGIDTDIRFVSKCCETTIFSDPECTNELPEPEEFFPW